MTLFQPKSLDISSSTGIVILKIPVLLGVSISMVSKKKKLSRHLVVGEKFAEVKPRVLPIVETFILNHDAVKVLVEAGLVVALDIEEKVNFVSRLRVKF